jgi:penicillin amidase
MRRRLRLIGRVFLIVLACLMGLAAVTALTFTLLLRGSLPRQDGERALPGLTAPVTVTRDSLGVPDIAAADRSDAARALGWLHAQDRFFQMDLQRRSAAGELAELLGPALVNTDRDARRHDFRRRAREVVAACSPDEQALLAAYADGVNAGLEDLRARPWEYFALRQKPAPWRPEDTVLTLHAMFMDLALWSARTEQAWGAVRDGLPPALARMLLPRTNRWEAPLEDAPGAAPVLPDSNDVDLRDWDYGGRTWRSFLDDTPPRQDQAGSNNWAVAGALTAHGGALLANDMHLGHGLPNIWYRARMSWPESDGRRAVVGVTLPGTPALVAGSNGDVAWGFTNSYGDWTDLVVVETDSADASRYRTPDGWTTFSERREIIAVAGAEPDTVIIRETIWGPIYGEDLQGRPLALRWTAHDTEAVNLGLVRLESAETVDQAVALAAHVGIPAQNLVCADRDGRIAWTIAGRIPRREGWDGRLPVSWADGAHRWGGYLGAAEQPRVVDPAEGRLWTANNRVAAGAHLALIGDGGYGLGARARQIRDDLRALDRPDETAMLGVQLDDRAVFLGEWRDLILAALDRRADELTADQRAFRDTVRDGWSGRAEPGSVAYPLVRSCVFQCIDEVYSALTGPIAQKDDGFRARELPYRHAVVWRLLNERPPHLLPPGHRDWDDVILWAAAQTMTGAANTYGGVARTTWGAHNQVRVAHPFTMLAPQLERWLAAPVQGLPGDSFMPRVQHRTSGASERMVVSPGREEDGIFHMPGGQSGHPLSHHFLAGHEAWAGGRPTPLLPGRPESELLLTPAR